MEKNMYCGSGPVPKGKERGTPEYCVQTNQVRYYGVKKIDKALLEKIKGKTPSLTKEKLKLKKIEDDAKILIKEVQKLKIITENKKATEAQQKKAQKKIDGLLVKRDKMVAKLKAQKSTVEQLEEEDKAKQERKAAKAKSRETSKSKSKTTTSKSKTKTTTKKKMSGSKTSSKKK